MEIVSNSSEYIRDNFKASEFYSKSYDAPQSHLLSSKVMDGWQFIRDYYSKPIRITSTARTSAGNFAAGGGANSQHLLVENAAFAADGEFLEDEQETMSLFYADMICKGPVYQSLTQLGIKGIGIYNGFIHLDDGMSPLNTRQGFTAWDGSDGRFGEIEFTTAYMNDVPEEGAPWCSGIFLLSIPEEIQKHTSKAKGLIDDLLAWTPEEGLAWNAAQQVALIVLILIFVYFALRKRNQ